MQKSLACFFKRLFQFCPFISIGYFPCPFCCRCSRSALRTRISFREAELYVIITTTKKTNPEEREGNESLMSNRSKRIIIRQNRAISMANTR